MKRIVRSLLIAAAVIALLKVASLCIADLPFGVQLVVRYLLTHPVVFALGTGCGLANARALAIAIAVVLAMVLWPGTTASVLAAATPMTLGILIGRLLRRWMISEATR